MTRPLTEEEKQTLFKASPILSGTELAYEAQIESLLGRIRKDTVTADPQRAWRSLRDIRREHGLFGQELRRERHPEKKIIYNNSNCGLFSVLS